MGDVALTRIKYGGSVKRDAFGNIIERTESKYVEVGQSLPSSGFTKDQVQELKAAGAIGDPSLLNTVARSTTAVLQSAEAEANAEALRAASPPVAATTPPSEDDIAKAHAVRTDQVSRAEGEDPAKVAESEAEARAKAEEKAANAQAKESAKS